MKYLLTSQSCKARVCTEGFFLIDVITEICMCNYFTRIYGHFSITAYFFVIIMNVLTTHNYVTNWLMQLMANVSFLFTASHCELQDLDHPHTHIPSCKVQLSGCRAVSSQQSTITTLSPSISYRVLCSSNDVITHTHIHHSPHTYLILFVLTLVCLVDVRLSVVV